MRVITKTEFNHYIHKFLLEIEKGALFVYPTDTIYGLGCDATNSNAVKKLRETKNSTQPLSVIAPSKEWIRNNCVLNEEAEEWVKKLPGQYTLVLKLKNKDSIAKEVNNDLDTIGVRIPDHWFSKVVSLLELPVITTSANIHGMYFMTTLEDLSPQIKSKVKFIVYEDEKRARPSSIIRLDTEELEVKER